MHAHQTQPEAKQQRAASRLPTRDQQARQQQAIHLAVQAAAGQPQLMQVAHHLQQQQQVQAGAASLLLLLHQQLSQTGQVDLAGQVAVVALLLGLVAGLQQQRQLAAAATAAAPWRHGSVKTTMITMTNSAWTMRISHTPWVAAAAVTGLAAASGVAAAAAAAARELGQIDRQA
jgi:hypothetical protein